MEPSVDASPDIETLLAAIARNNQRFFDLGFSKDRRNTYAHEINNWKTPEIAFAAAAEGLTLSAEDRGFAKEWLARRYPALDAKNFR
jgi:hypothetical protein